MIIYDGRTIEPGDLSIHFSLMPRFATVYSIVILFIYNYHSTGGQ